MNLSMASVMDLSRLKMMKRRMYDSESGGGI